jgi:hypothetical protein
MAERYVEDKTLMVDESNRFIRLKESDYTAIDHINIVSLLSSADRMETLEEPFGRLNQKQVNALLDESIPYLMLDNVFNHGIMMYYHNGLDPEAHDTVVFLEDESNNFYFMPYVIYEKLKETGVGE